MIWSHTLVASASAHAHHQADPVSERARAYNPIDQLTIWTRYIQKFIDTPVKHYSSGMYVCLAFAVAAHLEPEVLLVDEVLAVGGGRGKLKSNVQLQGASDEVVRR